MTQIINIPALAVTAPSGGGKATICQEISKLHSKIIMPPSTTTRQPKKEIHGKRYNHVSHRQFETLIQAGYFAEWNKYDSSSAECGYNYYGISKEAIEECLFSRAQDELLLLELDINGYKSLKKLYPHIYGVFLNVDYDERKRRLEERNSEEERERNVRLNIGNLECLEAQNIYSAGLMNKIIEYGFGVDRAQTAKCIFELCY